MSKYQKVLFDRNIKHQEVVNHLHLKFPEQNKSIFSGYVHDTFMPRDDVLCAIESFVGVSRLDLYSCDELDLLGKIGKLQHVITTNNDNKQIVNDVKSTYKLTVEIPIEWADILFGPKEQRKRNSPSRYIRPILANIIKNKKVQDRTKI